MTIIFASEEINIRPLIIDILEKVNLEKRIRVLDVGGGMNQWLGSLVTDVIDINPRLRRKKIHITVGDINEKSTWEKFRDNEFDFVSCTHTLEDIRDPKFVIEQLSRVGKTGFIAVPNRAVEFRHVENSEYLGYGHHRWIFHLQNVQYFSAVAKWIAISNEKVILNHYQSQISQKFMRKRFSTSSLQALQQFDNKHVELGLVWINHLNFKYFESDFAGESIPAMQNQSLRFLRSPFIIFSSQNLWGKKLINALLHDR